MRYQNTTLLSATALVSMWSLAEAGNLDAAIIEADPVAALSQLATFSGTTGSSAYTFTPTWSEELGFAASGALGYQTSDSTALGLFITAGQRQREALLNFGLAIDAERQIIFSGGQLQEKLEFGTEGAQEWVKQAEFGVAYDASNYAFSLYHVDSESTNNFVGAKSTGVEMDGSVGLSDVATLNYAAGYQTLSWDDNADDENGLTARLGLDYQATPDMLVNIFADHNVSENQFGIGAQWQVGAGTLSANYTRIDGNVGSITDDNRVALMLSMPLGGSNSSGAAVTGVATNGNSGAVVTSSSSLLADVMRRPDYLPQRVIVRAEQCYRVTSASYGFYDDVLQGIQTEFGSQARFVDWTEIRAFGYSDEKLSEFLDGAGLTDGMEAWVTNGGRRQTHMAWDVRWQVLNSFGLNPSGYYFVMDQLNSYELTLGRWNTPKRALAYVCD